MKNILPNSKLTVTDIIREIQYVFQKELGDDTFTVTQEIECAAALLDPETKCLHVNITVDSTGEGRITLWVYEEGEEFSDEDICCSFNVRPHNLTITVYLLLAAVRFD
jgi:hypothetical protein